MMERANHINIAMIEDLSTNGTARSKVVTTKDQARQPSGSTVSFHNIQYKVQLKSGFFCKRTSSPREILMDLKSVPTLSSCLSVLIISHYVLHSLHFLSLIMNKHRNAANVESKTNPSNLLFLDFLSPSITLRNYSI